MGEPLRLMVDLPNEAEIVTILTHQPGRKLLVASSAGDGFVVTEEDVVAFGKACDELERPLLIFCRSGARSTKMWELAEST